MKGLEKELVWTCLFCKFSRDYWNFVCDDEDGFNVMFEQYKKSAEKIKEALSKIKDMYFV